MFQEPWGWITDYLLMKWTEMKIGVCVSTVTLKTLDHVTTAEGESITIPCLYDN